MDNPLTTEEESAIDLSAISEQALRDSPPETQRRSNLGRRRLFRFLLWLVVIVVVVVLSLFITAWISGFRFANGFPDVLSMIEFVLDNTNLAK
jgi:cell division septal protein FtsQ